mgnify:CR=1 FL=1
MTVQLIAHPFRLGDDGRVATHEQDDDAYLAERIALILGCRPGERPLVPAFGDHGIDGWEFDVLSALRRAGDPYELSPGRLVQETLVTSGTMTNRIDRLAAKGWVERAPSPTDRRGVIVRLTDAGRSAVDGAMADLLDREPTPHPTNAIGSEQWDKSVDEETLED